MRTEINLHDPELFNRLHPALIHLAQFPTSSLAHVAKKCEDVSTETLTLFIKEHFGAPKYIDGDSIAEIGASLTAGESGWEDGQEESPAPEASLEDFADEFVELEPGSGPGLKANYEARSSSGKHPCLTISEKGLEKLGDRAAKLHHGGRADILVNRKTGQIAIRAHGGGKFAISRPKNKAASVKGSTMKGVIPQGCEYTIEMNSSYTCILTPAA